MEETYTICNPREEPIYGNIEDREEQHASTEEDIYDDVVPDEEFTYSYVNNPNTSISFEYPNPAFVGSSTQSIPEQRIEGNTHDRRRKEEQPKKDNRGICSVFILLLITDIAVVGIGVYYYILFTDKITENNDLLLATIAKLDSHNVSSALSKEFLVKQEAQMKATITKLDSLNLSSVLSQEVLVKQEAQLKATINKLDSLNVSSVLSQEVLVKQEAQLKATINKLDSLNISSMFSKEVLVKQEAQLKGVDNAVRKLQLHLAVDGMYGQWSNYTTCSRSCGKGYQTRSRKCDNPPPNIYGKNCTRLGNSTEIKRCNITICPSYRRVTSGSCTSVITLDECKQYAQSHGHLWGGTTPRAWIYPPGCHIWIPNSIVDTAYYNHQSSSKTNCSTAHQCVCIQ